MLITSGPDPAAPTTLKTAANPSLDSSVSRIPRVASSFRRVLSPTPTPMSTLLGMSSTRFKTLPVGSYVEVSPSGFKIARRIGELLYDGDSNGARSAGSALIVDYGGDKVYGNSFRVRVLHWSPPSHPSLHSPSNPSVPVPHPSALLPLLSFRSDGCNGRYSRLLTRCSWPLLGVQEPQDCRRVPPAWRVRPHRERGLCLSTRGRG